MTFPPPTAEEIAKKGILPYLDPLERWEISQPGNVLRVFERGGKSKPELGNPSLEEDPGKPEIKLSSRGFGTELRTDPVFLDCKRLVSSIRCSLSWHQRSAWRLPSQRMQCLPRHLCERSLAATFGRVCSPWESGADRHFRPDHSTQRIRPPDSTSVYALHSVEPVHGVPYSSGHEYGFDLLRLHVVGQ